MDGRTLEPNPERTWMGYSVGRWDGDTLVVESFGFNDRTWLDARGLPHTEALRTTERYARSNVGQLKVELTVTDPGAFAKPWTTAYDLTFGPDTERVEALCEDRTHWIGRLSDVEQSGRLRGGAACVRRLEVHAAAAEVANYKSLELMRYSARCCQPNVLPIRPSSIALASSCPAAAALRCGSS
jgi:hypothetical protein